MSGAPANPPAWLGVSRLVAKRMLSALLTLLLVSMVVFAAASLLPGDAAQEVLGQSATAEQVAASFVGSSGGVTVLFLKAIRRCLTFDAPFQMTLVWPFRIAMQG